MLAIRVYRSWSLKLKFWQRLDDFLRLYTHRDDLADEADDISCRYFPLVTAKRPVSAPAN